VHLIDAAPEPIVLASQMMYTVEKNKDPTFLTRKQILNFFCIFVMVPVPLILKYQVPLKKQTF